MRSETIKKFTSIDTLYLILLTIFTLEMFMVYWINENTKATRRIKPNKQLIFLSYSVITFIVFRLIMLLLMGVSPGTVAAVPPTFFEVVNLLHGVCNFLFAILLRGSLNRLLGIEPGSKYYFKLIWTILLGPIYINYNINKIKEGEMQAQH
ncbi:MAG: hypothetical protein ABFS18_01710 [Thermodesulfobacteriota bacterium]